MKKWSIVLIFALVVSIMPAALATGADSNGPSYIWGVDTSNDTGELVLLDAWTGIEYARFDLPNTDQGDTKVGLTGAGAQLYYINSDDNVYTAYILDTSDGSIIDTVALAGGWTPDGLGYYGGAPDYLYTAGCVVGDLHRYLASSGSAEVFWSTVNSPLAVGGDDSGRIFTTDLYYDEIAQGNLQQIAEVDPLNNVAPLNTFAAPSQDIVGMAFDGTYLYVSDMNDMLYIMDPDDGTVLNTLDLEDYSLYALATSDLLTVEKESIGYTDPDGDGIVEIGEEYEWVWRITVTNNSPLTISDILLKDNLAGDLKLMMVDADEWGNDLIDNTDAVPTMVPPPPDSKKKKDNEITVNGFDISWSGNTKKVHWSFEGIPDLASGESYIISMMVGTDINPAGIQEYTSTGVHIQNSGATAKGLLDGIDAVDGVSDPLSVEVFEQDSLD